MLSLRDVAIEFDIGAENVSGTAVGAALGNRVGIELGREDTIRVEVSVEMNGGSVCAGGASGAGGANVVNDRGGVSLSWTACD